MTQGPDCLECGKNAKECDRLLQKWAVFCCATCTHLATKSVSKRMVEVEQATFDDSFDDSAL